MKSRVWEIEMIWLLVIFFVVLYIITTPSIDDEERAWYGPDEYDRRKREGISTKIKRDTK